MSPSRETRELRALAADILAIEERTRSLLRLSISNDTADLLSRDAISLSVLADAWLLQAEMLASAQLVPTLFQWMETRV